MLWQVTQILDGSHNAQHVQIATLLVEINNEPALDAEVHIEETAVIRFDPVTVEETDEMQPEAMFPQKCTHFVNKEAIIENQQDYVNMMVILSCIR